MRKVLSHLGLRSGEPDDVPHVCWAVHGAHVVDLLSPCIWQATNMCLFTTWMVRQQLCHVPCNSMPHPPVALRYACTLQGHTRRIRLTCLVIVSGNHRRWFCKVRPHRCCAYCIAITCEHNDAIVEGYLRRGEPCKTVSRSHAQLSRLWCMALDLDPTLSLVM